MKYIVTTIKNCVILCVMLMILGISVNAQTGSVQGITFGDSGSDCLNTPDDEPLGGIEIGIFGPDGAEIIATTDDNGSFLFTELPPGNYTVCVESLPEGWSLSGFGCQTIDIAEGEAGNVDFCFISENLIGCINAYAFHDLNINGVWDPDENPYEGVNCFLRDANNNVISVGLTDANGLCQFPNLPFGNYSVSVTNESGYYVTNLYSFSTNINSTECYDYSFGYDQYDEPLDNADASLTTTTSSIWGNVFHDLNGDCIPDPDDLSLEGIEVFVVSPDGAKSSTISDPLGEYHFENLEPGSYTVLIGEIPTGYYLSGSTEYTFELAPGEHLDNVNFCYGDNSMLGSICGVVMDEFYCVGYFDITVVGVTVYLHDDFGNVIDITETDSTGYFTFENLGYGSYVVSYQSLPVSDSPVYIESTECFLIEENIICPIPDPGPDMGGIHGSILYDLNGDCIHQYGEEIGLAGVEISLIFSDGTKQITYSATNGEYYFGNLSDGLYTVVVGEASLFYELNSLSNIAVYIADGEVVTDQNFCYHQVEGTAALCGYVFVDINCDAVLEGEDLVSASYYVSLFVDSTTLLGSIATDASGYFAFENLPFDSASEYSIVAYVDVPNPTGDSGTTYYTNQTVTLSEDGCTTPEYFGACFFGEYYAGIEVDAGVDSTITISSSIWGNAFVDLDDDCLLHSTESGFAGIEVSLISPDGTKTITSTQADGSYHFENLDDGQYSVIIGQTPEGYELASLPNINLFLDIDEHADNQNFCYHIIEGSGSFCGNASLVYCNENSNTNLILDNSSVNLLLDGIVIATAITDDNGYFVFENIPYDVTSAFTIGMSGHHDIDFGSFYLYEGEFVVDINANGCADPQNYNVCIISEGSYVEEVDEIDPVLGSLCGYIFVDNNCDTVFEGEDSVTDFYEVVLLNGVAVIQTTTAGPDGSFSFEDVAVNAEGGYSITSYIDVPDDATGLSGSTYYANYDVVITEGPCGKLDYFGACFEAGYYTDISDNNGALGALCGYVFVDNNCDENFEGEDYVTISYTVSLLDGTTIVGTTTAGIDGYFSFENVAVNAQNQYSIISYIDVPDVEITGAGSTYYANYPVVITEGPCGKSDYFGACFEAEYVPDVDPPVDPVFGSLCGYVFVDKNCDSVFEGEDFVTSSYIVSLFDGATLVETTTAGIDGHFSFEDVNVNAQTQYTIASYVDVPEDETGDSGTNYYANYEVVITEGACSKSDYFGACFESHYDSDENANTITLIGSFCGYAYFDGPCNAGTSTNLVASNIDIELLSNGSIIATATSDNNGYFAFDSIVYDSTSNFILNINGYYDDLTEQFFDYDGEYMVDVNTVGCDAPQNYNACVSGYGQYDPDNPPVDPVLGSLCGYVFVDTNCDGVFEGEDFVTSSYIVSLFDGETLVETTTAGIDGQFSFEDIDIKAQAQHTIASYVNVLNVDVPDVEFGTEGYTYYANYEVDIIEGSCGKLDYFGACFDSSFGEEDDGDPILTGSFCGYAYFDGPCNAGTSTNLVASNIDIELLSNGSIIATVTSDNNGYFAFDSIVYDSTSNFILNINGYYDDLTEQFFDYDGEYMVDVNTVGCDAPQNYNACVSGYGQYDPPVGNSLGAVCGYVYLDESCNSTITLADSTWVGWQVSLLDANNEPAYVTFAGENGQFSFTNVEYGTYQVYYQGFSPDIYEITINDEQCYNLNNYALCIPETDPDPVDGELASIWGNVFHDHSGDCLVDANETGFLGITISLTATDGTQTFTTTDVNGEYHFENLEPGIYTVAIVSDPNGYYLTGQSTLTVSLDYGDHTDNVNFCYESIENFGGICGALGFSDNCDQVINNYLGGFTVYLHDFTNSIVSIQPTNANGEYEFTDLPAGYYSVSVDNPETGFDLLNETKQSFSIAVGDCYQAAPFIYCDGEEPVDPGPDPTGEETASIWGNVFHDLNDDCYVQTGEMGLAGIAVTLISPDGGEITVFTDEFGAYHFENLIPEEYTIYIGQMPEGYSLNSAGSIAVTLVAGQHQDHLNFCLHYSDPLGGIYGSVLVDTGCDGNNDGGLFGVPVYLTDGSGDVLTIQTSGANGAFSFANLPLGNYTVYVGANPVGYSLNSITEYNATVAVDECTDVDAFVYCEGGSGEPGELSSIWGNVFHDLNDDCLHQTSESGIGGVEITLFGDQGFKTSTFSAADGSYHFENIQAGLYTVVVGVAPNGYVLVGATNITLMLESGEHQDNVNYCFVQESQMANVCGSAFIDIDCNGLQDGSDQLFSEVLVYLHDGNNTVIEVVSTDASGQFTFDNIPLGTYTVSVATGPAGYQSSTNADVSVNLTSGDCNDVPAFGFCEEVEPPVVDPGSIWGNVFHDQNGNCLVDANETGLNNITVTLSDTNGNILATTTSSSTGEYHFENYAPGVYTVTVGTAPDGYVLDGSFTTTVIIGSGEHIDNVNFCYGQVLEYGSICGVAFIDPNCDGSNEDATVGMQGATILLFNKDGQVINSSITDENGNYSFVNLAIDFYAVSVGNHSSDYTLSTSNQQNFDISAGACFEVSPLGFCEIVDEVEPELGSICGVVYYDSNSDGSLNNIEIGLSGVTVYLYNEFGEFVTATNTDSNGNYCFHGLISGNYKVGVQTGPNGTLLTTDDIFSVTVGPGENIIEIVFGFGPENTGNGCFADVGTIANDGLPICEGGNIFVQNVNSGIIPLDFSKSYVLENGLTQEIIEINSTGAFTSLPIGLYFVYTVVYDEVSINLNDYNSIAAIKALFNENGAANCGDVLEEGLPYIVHSCGDPCTNETVCGAENVCTEAANLLQLCPTFCAGVELVSEVGHSTFNCSLEDLGNGCFSYTPINGLDIIGYDEVSIKGFDANGNCYAYNYYISIGNCVDLTCAASAAELQSTSNSICEGQTAYASITTLPAIPIGFVSVYVLTDENGQLLQLENSSPQFANLAIGSYNVYNVVINTNDINLNQIGNISAINALFAENGGTLCGSISANPVSFNVGACCTANTGELGASSNSICLGSEISAMHMIMPIVPAGFTEAFVLVDGNGNLQELNFSPNFTVYSLGDYYIYNIIADLTQFDLNQYSSIYELSNVNQISDFCLVVQANPVAFNVIDCTPIPTCGNTVVGNMSATNYNVCIDGQISASHTTNSQVPNGYSELYVLTDSNGNLLELNTTPSFNGNLAGSYFIYNIIANTNEFDLNNFSTISSLISYASGTDICVSIQNNPAQVLVSDCTPPQPTCDNALAGAMSTTSNTVCQGAQILGYHTTNSVIPNGFTQLYLMTDLNGSLLQLNSNPTFDATNIGSYLVYNIILNTNDLDINSVSSIGALLNLANDPNVCLTVQSNPLQIQVTDCTPPPTGCPEAQPCLLATSNAVVCLNASISAYHTTVSIVPTGHTEIYILTAANGSIVTYAYEPNFLATGLGNYFIYNLVADLNQFNIDNYGNISDVINYANAVDVCVAVQQSPVQIQVTDCTPPPTGCPEAQPCLLATSNAVVCLNASISAYHTTVSIVPTGHTEIYILTAANGSIVTYAYEPNFPATGLGNYFIYNLVADLNQFNIDNYGNISDVINYANAVDVCVAVQQSPVQIQVTDCTPPPTGCPEAQPCLLATSNAVVCLNATISAYHTVASIVPTGYNEIYILVELTGNIVTYAYEPNFPATGLGNYFIYNLVADLNQFNIDNYGNISDVINYANAVDVCISVQQSPVQIQVTDCTTEPPTPTTCTAVQAGYISSANSSICLGESFEIYHTKDSTIPIGLNEVYLITNLVGDLIDWSYEPVFVPAFGGEHYIYNAVLDLNTVDINSYNTIFDLQIYANAESVCGSVQEIPFMIMVKDCTNTEPPCTNDVVYECVAPVTPVILCPTFCDIGGDYTITGTHTIFTCSITLLGDGCVRYTPLPGFIGDEEVVMTACDAQGKCETALAIVTVGDCTNTTNTAPIANDDNLSTNYNTPTHINLIANDIDAEGDQLYLCNTENDLIAQNGTISMTDSGVIYTPNDGFIGTDSFTYTVCDGNGGATTGIVNVTVLGPGECNPNVNVCVEPFLSMDNNSGVLICIDFCTPGAVIAGYESDFGCSIEIMNDFCIEYVPLPGFEGLHPITVTACNEFEQCEIASVVVDVTDLCDGVITQNMPPLANDDNYETSGNTPIITEILVNDNDPDNDELEICAFSQPASGVIAATSSSFVYTPMPGFVGTDSFTYTICDPDGLQSTATVSVTVTGLDCIVEASYCVLPSDNGISHLDVCVDFCSQGMNISFLSTTFDCGLGNIEGACFTYSPLPGFLGNDVIEVIGCNDFGFCETAIIYVNVNSDCGDSLIFSRVNQEVNYRISDVFTPNGDGINEEVRIFSDNVYLQVDADASIVIFNSLGQVVYTQEGPVQSIVWSNENGNVQLSEGTYYYQIEIVSQNQLKPILLNGYIELRK